MASGIWRHAKIPNSLSVRFQQVFDNIEQKRMAAGALKSIFTQPNPQIQTAKDTA